MRDASVKKWWVLAALTLVGAAIGLDMTVLNLALPTLSIVFHASSSELQWFMDAYTLVVAAVMMPAGLLGDRFGRKKLILGALVVFGASSVLCAFAHNAEVFIVGRIMLGFGASFVIPLSTAAIPIMFNDESRSRAVTILMVGTMLSLPLGPVIGGWLLDHFWWGWIFLINLPVVIVTIIAIAILLPTSKRATIHVDFFGSFVSSVGLVSTTYGIIQAGENGWDNNSVWISLCIGGIFLILFVIRERKAKYPLIEPVLFKVPGFSGGVILTTLVNFMLFGILFVVPQYFQDVRDIATLGSGIRLLPLIGGLIVGGIIADEVVKRIGMKPVITIGFALMTLGTAIGAQTNVYSGDLFTLAWLALFGGGLGLALPTSMDAALAALSPAEVGVGSAFLQVTRQVGGTMGVALLGTLVNAKYRSHLDLSGWTKPIKQAVERNVTLGANLAHQLHSQSLLGSIHIAFVYGEDVMIWVVSAVALAGMILAATFLPGRILKVRKK